MKEIVFATNNQHKLRELREIVGNRFKILSLEEIGCHEDIPETADSIEGNACIKAVYVKEHYGYDCFADDTGLEIEALDGAPGVYTARFAGEECDPQKNIDKVLECLEGKENRRARFRTAIALILGDSTHIFEGEVQGEILTERHGEAGFGYDPIFKPLEADCSFAEMDADDKNAISHRGRATAKLIEYLMRPLVIIFGASSSKIPQDYLDASYELGKKLAENGYGGINGGGEEGVMGRTTDGMIAAGGHMLGVIPRFFVDAGLLHKGLEDVVVTEDMHTRKNLMYSRSSAAIVMPGGVGTFDEMMEIITWRQLKLYQKPVIVMNINGFFDDILRMLIKCEHENFLRPTDAPLFQVATTVDEAIQLLNMQVQI